MIFRYTLHTCSGLQTSVVCKRLANCIPAHAVFEKRLAFVLQKVGGKGHLTPKKEKLSAILVLMTKRILLSGYLLGLESR